MLATKLTLDVRQTFACPLLVLTYFRDLNDAAIRIEGTLNCRRETERRFSGVSLIMDNPLHSSYLTPKKLHDVWKVQGRTSSIKSIVG